MVAEPWTSNFVGRYRAGFESHDQFTLVNVGEGEKLEAGPIGFTKDPIVGKRVVEGTL